MDLMNTRSALHWHGLQLAAQYFYGGGFDYCVQHESAARVSLAIGAMAAVHSHRLVLKLIAHMAAGASAGELLCRPLPALFHKFSLVVTGIFVDVQTKVVHDLVQATAHTPML